MNTNEGFQTSDLALTATLVVFGYWIKSIDKNDRRAVFLIVPDKDLDTIVDDYYNRKLQVDPLEYFNALKNVKTRLYG